MPQGLSGMVQNLMLRWRTPHLLLFNSITFSLVQALRISHTDYNNNLRTGLPASTIPIFQSVLNTTVREILLINKSDYVQNPPSNDSHIMLSKTQVIPITL